MKFSDIKRRKLSFFNNSNNNKNRHNAAATSDKGNPETAGESSTGRPASAPAGTTSPAIRSQLQAAFATPASAASTPPRNSLQPTGRGSSCDSSPTSSIGDAYEQGRK